MNRLPRRTLLSLGALVVLFALAGCETAVPLNEPARGAPVETRAVGPAGAGGSSTPATGAAAGGAPQSQVATVDLSRNAGAGGAALLAAPTQRVVYFDFDSYAIRDDFRAMLEGHARALTAQPSRRMLVEGHTDDRGGREYNLALGQKRAEAVLRSLTLLGVAEQQLEAVSFGKERPAVEGSDENAWARNRRAELKER